MVPKLPPGELEKHQSGLLLHLQPHPQTSGTPSSLSTSCSLPSLKMLILTCSPICSQIARPGLGPFHERSLQSLPSLQDLQSSQLQCSFLSQKSQIASAKRQILGPFHERSLQSLPSLQSSQLQCSFLSQKSQIASAKPLKPLQFFAAGESRVPGKTHFHSKSQEEHTPPAIKQPTLLVRIVRQANCPRQCQGHFVWREGHFV